MLSHSYAESSSVLASSGEETMSGFSVSLASVDSNNIGGIAADSKSPSTSSRHENPFSGTNADSDRPLFMLNC